MSNPRCRPYQMYLLPNNAIYLTLPDEKYSYLQFSDSKVMSNIQTPRHANPVEEVITGNKGKYICDLNDIAMYLHETLSYDDIP